jgi:hypothetical protein
LPEGLRTEVETKVKAEDEFSITPSTDSGSTRTDDLVV